MENPVETGAPAAHTNAGALDEEKHQANIKIAEGNNELDGDDVKQFQYLLEKSQQLFAGLRDLPPTGRNWQPYFQRTFEVYTKLWKFQQQHRAVLENKDYYGLKRSEIGEAASKIGQLYYHYYLRTSETNYLFESFIFYEAIRDRQYFKEPSEGKSLPLVIKKLRYFARFIVVCLLLNRNDMIKKLMDELSALVDSYIKEFKPTDAAEWNVVLSEISTFLEAEKKLTPINLKGEALFTPNRVQIEKSTKVDKEGAVKLKLQEAILIKFSELTLDMYRMLQSLEREPAAQGASAGEKKDGVLGEDVDKSATRRTNPHKYLLYRPTLAQLLLYIATAFKDINDNSAMLIYLSADGAKRMARGDNSDAGMTLFYNSCLGYTGGITTATHFARKAADATSTETSAADASSLVHCLHPNDLTPFTRKPVFIIVDSTNSTAFQSIPRVFSAPLVCLMGPTEYPTSIKDTTQIGSLFTLFLHTPIKAFAFISNISQLSDDLWNDCIGKMNAIEKTIQETLEANVAQLDKSYKRFLQDDFLGQFITRFILCHVLLSAHTDFKESKHLPTATPSLPASVLSAGDIVSKVQELVTVAEVVNLYNFNAGAAPERTSVAAVAPAVAPATAPSASIQNLASTTTPGSTTALQPQASSTEVAAAAAPVDPVPQE